MICSQRVQRLCCERKRCAKRRGAKEIYDVVKVLFVASMNAGTHLQCTSRCRQEGHCHISPCDDWQLQTNSSKHKSFSCYIIYWSEHSLNQPYCILVLFMCEGHVPNRHRVHTCLSTPACTILRPVDKQRRAKHEKCVNKKAAGSSKEVKTTRQKLQAVASWSQPYHPCCIPR